MSKERLIKLIEVLESADFELVSIVPDYERPTKVEYICSIGCKAEKKA